MNELNITEQFSNLLYQFSLMNYEEKVWKEAKNCLLDYVGVTIAGAHIQRNKSLNLLNRLLDQGHIKLVGLDFNTTLQNAILINGINAHVIELDDGHRKGMMHPGAPIISALLPLYNSQKIDGNALLKGIIVGYEASIRMAACLQPSLKDKGFHGTGIAGSVGVSAAIAAAMQFNEKQFFNSVSAACTSASGILKVIKDVSELKPYNVGNAALSGFQAAMLALAGYRGPKDTLGGELGFLNMMSNGAKVEILLRSIHEEPFILSIYRKPYAACRHCHAPIEAMLNAQKRHSILSEEIEKIEVKTYYWAVGGHDHFDINSINSAKMSTPYSVAVAAIEHKAGLKEFSEDIILREDILALARKVSVNEDPELTSLAPNKRAAKLIIRLKNGSEFVELVEFPLGEPENPILPEELKIKFTSLCQYANMTEESIENLYQSILSIDQVEKIIF